MRWFTVGINIAQEPFEEWCRDDKIKHKYVGIVGDTGHQWSVRCSDETLVKMRLTYADEMVMLVRRRAR